MRFRYFDSEGTEVELSSVDALRFRIQTGVVTPETLLYDAAAGQWGPARQNPLFRFLVEEDEDLLPEEHRDLMAGGESSSSSTGSETGSAIPWSSPRADFDSEDLDAAVEEGVESLEETPTEEGTAEADEVPAFPDEPGRETAEPGTLDSLVPEEGAGVLEDGSGFPDLELASPEVSWARAEDARDDEAPGGEVAAESPPSESSAIEPTRVDQAPPEDAPRPDPSYRHASFPSAPLDADEPPPRVSSDSESTYQDGYSRRRRSRPSLPGVAALSILMVFLVGIPILVLGGGEAGDDGTAYALVGGLADDLVSGEETGEDVWGSEEASAEVESRGSARDEPPVAVAPPPTVPDRLDVEEIESLAAEADDAASADIEDALANLRLALRVPETPPAEWLQGRYLAEPASLSGVERYWVAFASLVTSMRELERELYRGFLQGRVLGMRLDTADAARISALALERYEERSEERADLYRDLDLLASNAIALHDTLVARSDDIAERGFDGTTLTRYPFMAAVPDDPVLAEHIWSRVDGILDILQELDGARPGSVTELRAAVRRTTPGGAGDPLDELPDWWPRPADRGGAPGPSPAFVQAEPEPILPEPEDLPVPTQEVVVPD